MERVVVPYTELCLRRSKRGFAPAKEAETGWTWSDGFIGHSEVPWSEGSLYNHARAKLASWDERFEAMVDAMDGTSQE